MRKALNRTGLARLPSANEVTAIMDKLGWKKDRKRRPGNNRQDAPVHCYSKAGDDKRWWFFNEEVEYFQQLYP